MSFMTELICPNCHVALDERQLLGHTWSVETCPHCRAVVRKEENRRHQDLDALIRDDVESIETWLQAVALDAAGRGETFRAEQHSSKKAGHVCRWEVTAGEGESLSPAPWDCTVEYDADTPRVFEVRLTSKQDGRVFLDSPALLLDACAEHGVQPHACEERRWVQWEGERLEVRWGAKQLLATGCLGVALFRAVVRRLSDAMRGAQVSVQKPATAR